MKYIFKFPDIGEGLEEGTILEVYVKVGQTVKAGDLLVNMETDKVAADIPSPKAGKILKIFGNVGDVIHVGKPLVELELAKGLGDGVQIVKKLSGQKWGEWVNQPFVHGRGQLVGGDEQQIRQNRWGHRAGRFQIADNASLACGGFDFHHQFNLGMAIVEGG